MGEPAARENGPQEAVDAEGDHGHDLSTVVQGTAENLLNRLEENLSANPGSGPGANSVPEEELLLSSHPGPLDKEGKNVEDVLNIISQSIFREGEGEHAAFFKRHLLQGHATPGYVTKCAVTKNRK